MMATTTASWAGPAVPAAVSGLRGRVVDFARAHRVDHAILGRLRLAASEAISNAVQHAYRDRDEPGDVTASIRIDDDAGVLELVVADGGVGMSPRHDSPGAGFGIGILERVADQVSIQPGAGGVGTRVRLVFRSAPT